MGKSGYPFIAKCKCYLVRFLTLLWVEIDCSTCVNDGTSSLLLMETWRRIVLVDLNDLTYDLLLSFEKLAPDCSLSSKKSLSYE